MQLPLLYRDADVAVFAKPSGLVVHRGWADDAVTALDLARDAVGARVHPVHRLDRSTSGVLVFTLNPECAAALQTSFERGDVEKTYLALVRGTPPESGVIDHPVPRAEKGERVDAVTAYRLLFAVTPSPPAPAALRRVSLVEARPRTGRLHQIRRHLKHLNHPIIGDVNYGKGDLNRLFRAEISLTRLALHARSIRFPHPRTGAILEISAPLPDDLREPFSQLGIPRETWGS